MKSEAEDMYKVALLVAGFFLLLAGSVPLEAQNPVTGAARTEMLRNLRPSGQPVIPLFEVGIMSQTVRAVSASGTTT